MPDVTITAIITQITSSPDGVLITLDSHPDKESSTAEALSAAIAGGETQSRKREPTHYGVLYMPEADAATYEEGQKVSVTFGAGSKKTKEPKGDTGDEMDEFVDDTQKARQPEY